MRVLSRGQAGLRSRASVRKNKRTYSTDVKKPLLMIPGPVECSPGVLAAMGDPAVSHVGPGFVNSFGESIEMMRQAFLCKKGQPFIVSASGTLGWDMAASNLLEKGDKALVVNTGYFGDKFGESLEAYDCAVTHLRAPVGDAPSISELEAALSKDKFKMVTITHVDTSTGVLVDIPGYAKAIRKCSPDTLIVVDGVCATGGEETRMDDWDLDYVLTASQKAFGVPPGLCLSVASERAMDAFNSRQSKIPNYYASWQKWLPIMKAYESQKPSYFATPPVNLVNALRVSLKEMLYRGMEDTFKAHNDAAADVHRFLGEAGLDVVPVRKELCANTLSAIRYPEGVTGPKLLPEIIKNGAIVAGGLHAEIKDEYFRLGHMGYSVTNRDEKHIERTLQAIVNGIDACKA